MSNNDNFTTLPHPAKTNYPAENESNQINADKINIFDTPGPVIPSDETKKNIPLPKSKEELKAKQAELDAAAAAAQAQKSEN